MTDNDKLTAWQDNGSTPGKTPPDYSTDAAACMSLLDTLVERGKWFILQNDSEGGFALEIGGLLDFRDSIFVVQQSTVNEAIIAACLEVIEREEENGKD